jgi:hypothetical protein
MKKAWMIEIFGSFWKGRIEGIQDTFPPRTNATVAASSLELFSRPASAFKSFKLNSTSS